MCLFSQRSRLGFRYFWKAYRAVPLAPPLSLTGVSSSAQQEAGVWGPRSRFCFQYYFHRGAGASRCHALPASPAEPAVGQGSASELGRREKRLPVLEATHFKGWTGREELSRGMNYQTQLLTWPIRVHQFTSKYSQSLFTSPENDCLPGSRTWSHLACDSEKLFLFTAQIWRSSHCAFVKSHQNHLTTKDVRGSLADLKMTWMITLQQT